MDQLRARALTDLVTGSDSRPGPQAQHSTSPVPAGFAATVNLTVPLATILDLADRPGDLSGFGPVDPWLARDLARAAAGNPKTTWCVTVTDADGHAIGHDCARPQPKNRSRPSKRGEGGKRDGPEITGRDREPRAARAWLRVHPHQPRRATRRLWHLDPKRPRTRL